MTIKGVKAYVRYVARRWKLEDWEIIVEVLSKELQPTTEANIHWVGDYKKAWIGYNPSLSREDLRWAIRHEMLHLRLEGHMECAAREPVYEFAINVISRMEI